MFGEICSNFTHTFLHGNETFLFDHELECTVSKTVFVLFTFIGIAGLLGNAMVVLGKRYCGVTFTFIAGGWTLKILIIVTNGTKKLLECPPSFTFLPSYFNIHLFIALLSVASLIVIINGLSPRTTVVAANPLMRSTTNILM